MTFRMIWPAVLVIAGLSQWAGAGEAPAGGEGEGARLRKENEELRAQVRQYEQRMKELENRVRELERARQPDLKIIPAPRMEPLPRVQPPRGIIPMPNPLPRPPSTQPFRNDIRPLVLPDRVPADWQEREFNGIKYYIIPLQ
jgi:hypothetical protein